VASNVKSGKIRTGAASENNSSQHRHEAKGRLACHAKYSQHTLYATSGCIRRNRAASVQARRLSKIIRQKRPTAG